MKFLIIRFSSIGDIVLTTPVIRGIKKQVPGAVIHFLTKKNFGTILEANPYVDKIHLLDEDLLGMTETLRTEEFDVIIDLHKNIRSMRIKRALGKTSFSFEKLNLEKWLLTNFKWNRMPAKHIVDRYLETVNSFGVVNDGGGLDYFIPPGEEMKRSDLPDVFREGYLGLVVGAAHATKRIPLEKMSEICMSVDFPIVLLGGKEDTAMAELLRLLKPEKIYNACGRYSLHQSASLLSKARLVITPDTGLMHIAAAFQQRIIALWGNTVPEFGMYPYYGNKSALFVNMEVSGLSCRPCSKIGFDACPKKHFRCMMDQDIRTIISDIFKYW